MIFDSHNAIIYHIIDDALCIRDILAHMLAIKVGYGISIGTAQLGNQYTANVHLIRIRNDIILIVM